MGFLSYESIIFYKFNKKEKQLDKQKDIIANIINTSQCQDKDLKSLVFHYNQHLLKHQMSVCLFCQTDLKDIKKENYETCLK